MSDNNPFEEEPDVELEQTCWRDSSRYCGKECVSYDERCETDPRWTPCLLLNLKRAEAKSYASISLEMKRFNDAGHTSNFVNASEADIKKALSMREAAHKKEEAEAYARKVQEMDVPPPEIK